jgi:hypothetical protein
MPTWVKKGVLGAILVPAALFLGVRSSREAAGQATPRAQQWEYKIVDFSNWVYTEGGRQFQRDKQISSFTDGFNELGSAGWEYFGAAAEGTGNHLLVFKRPKR